MEKYGFVYIWYDKKHRRYYIGSHWGREDDRYICSSTWMRNAYKRRPQDFKRRIIERTTERSDLLIMESKWLERIHDDEIGKKYYNLTNKIRGLWHMGEFATEICEKISYTKRGRAGKLHSIETRNKMSRSHMGKKHNANSIQKMRNKYLSEETRNKMSVSKTGIALPPRSAEHRNAISVAKTGKKNKIETNEKISATMKGRKFSDEHRLKLREARLKYLQGE